VVNNCHPGCAPDKPIAAFPTGSRKSLRGAPGIHGSQVHSSPGLFWGTWKLLWY